MRTRRESLVWSSVAAFVVAAASACGDGGQPGPGGSSPGGGDPGGQGGAGAGAGEGAAGGAGGRGPAVTVPACAGGEARIAGTLDGSPIDETYQPNGVGVEGATHIVFGDLGNIFLRGAEGFSTEWSAGPGWLRMPQEGPRADTWWCAAPSSAVRFDGDSIFEARVESLTFMGSCPGTPVAGEVSICLDPPSCGGVTIDSTVEGASFHEEPMFGGGYGPIGGTTAVIELHPGGGVFVLEADGIDPASTGLQTSPLGTAYFIVPAGAPDEGAVYCVGEGSTLDYVMDPAFGVLPMSAQLQNISRLGSCAGAGNDGGVGFCMNLGD
jgi:hypothetical protein